MSKPSGENQQADESGVSKSYWSRSSVCKGRDLSMMSKTLACLVIALGAAVVVLSGCNTKTTSSTAITPVPSPVVHTADKPAATTANSGAEAETTRATVAKSAAGAGNTQKQKAAKAIRPARKHVAAVARNHRQVPLRKKATVAAGPASATTEEQKRDVEPVEIPVAGKPAAATAEKPGQPGVWESPLRSLRTPKCGPSGCGPSGCP